MSQIKAAFLEHRTGLNELCSITHTAFLAQSHARGPRSQTPKLHL